MKTRFCIVVLCLTWGFSYSQVLNTSDPQVQAALGNAQVEGSPLANFFQKRTPMMDILFPLIKDDDGIERHYVGAEVGSAYVSDQFQPGRVFYNDDELGQVYYRLNAYNEEIEIKKTQLDEEKQLALIKNEEISLVTNSKKIIFRSFLDTRGREIEGYLNELWEGNNYILYQRIYKKFTEPKPAANSMVAPTPSRFTDYTSFYYQKIADKEIVELPVKTKKLLNTIPEANTQVIKEYIKENSIDLEQENDLIKLFRYIDEL